MRKLPGFRQKVLGRHISMVIMMRRKGSSEQVTPLQRHAVDDRIARAWQADDDGPTAHFGMELLQDHGIEMCFERPGMKKAALAAASPEGIRNPGVLVAAV
jgi:hypothetical protein